MIHLFIAFDNEDSKQGDYFTRSQEHLIEQLSNTPFIQQFNSQSILNNEIPVAIREINSNIDTPFIFVSYTHGKQDALCIDDKSFIDRSNAYLFGETLFYACSCLAAQKLGNELINNNCRVFIGYNDYITTAFPESEPAFYHCENAFLIQFITTDETIQDCIQYMYNVYSNITDQIDSVSASILNKNLRVFKAMGDLQLTRQYFIPEKSL